MPSDSGTSGDFRNTGLGDALRKSEERFRRVVESALSAMVMIRATGQIELVNAQAERLFGYPREELIGQFVELLVPERFRGPHPALRGMFFSDPKPRPMGAGRDLFALRKDGSEFPLEIGLNPIDTDDGPMVLATMVDLSARKRMEERFRVFVEAAPSAMIKVSATGQIEMVNTQAEHIFGYPRQEPLGSTPRNAGAGKLPRRSCRALRELFYHAAARAPWVAGRLSWLSEKTAASFPWRSGSIRSRPTTD